MSMIVLFCILHSEIYVSLSTKILQDFLLYPWYLYRFVQILSLSKILHDFLHPLLWNFYKFYHFLTVSVHVNDYTFLYSSSFCISLSTKILHDFLLYPWYLYRFVQILSLSKILHDFLHPLPWNFYKFYHFLTVSVYVNDCTTLFCIFHSEICISLSTKILHDSLLHLWYLYRFVQILSLSTKFYIFCILCLGIFINSITSKLLCMLMIAQLLFLHSSSWNFYIIFISFFTKLLHDSLLHL